MATTPRLSPRLQAVVDALPLRPGLRVVETGCGTGGVARAVAQRVGPNGHVLAVDRSQTAIEQLTRTGANLIAAGVLTGRRCSVEELDLGPGEPPYDLAFAIRVGALDGRHPDAGTRALERLANMLTPAAPLYIDGGDPLQQIHLPSRGDED